MLAKLFITMIGNGEKNNDNDNNNRGKNNSGKYIVVFKMAERNL